MAIFLPTARDSMLAHPLWGWVLAVGATCLIPVVGEMSRKAALRNLKLDKDLRLIAERLAGWDATGYSMTYLTEYANHDHFESQFARKLEDSVRSWDLDSRTIHNKKLRNAFKNVQDSAVAYRSAIFDNMWSLSMKYDGVNDHDHIRVPVEWQDANPARAQKAYQRLDDARFALTESLRALARLRHDFHSAPQRSDED